MECQQFFFVAHFFKEMNVRFASCLRYVHTVDGRNPANQLRLVDRLSPKQGVMLTPLVTFGD